MLPVSLPNATGVTPLFGLQVRAAGKKSYTMLVGKPNAAKLANFPE
jgi:hypothetical protein